MTLKPPKRSEQKKLQEKFEMKLRRKNLRDVD